MAKYTQVNRWLRVYTPLGADKLLLTRFEGTERLSEAFCFRLEMVAELDTEVEFDKILGQQICVEIAPPKRPARYLSGIVVAFSQGRRDDAFQYFSAEVRPKFWNLSKRRQSRIFQQKTAPQVLETALAGVEQQPQLTAEYLPHNFCVQYRESDFEFANRLMEEEGIYYFHEHTRDGHKLLLADASTQAKKLTDGATLKFDPARGGRRDDVRIGAWTKTQRIAATHYELWDHQFQLPGQTLGASQALTTTVQAGGVTHTLAAKGTETLGDFDFPGGYAHRFDGIDPAGAEQADDVQHVFTANDCAAGLRMQREACRALTIAGESNAPHLAPGYQFTLAGHYDGDGDYFLTGVTHRATQSFSRPGQEDEPPTYENSFECVPASLAWRPAASTPAPRIQGTQNAVVVGPAGEQIFTDKYGRIKVQFLWDRQGQHDVHSSCWLRVQQFAAGNSWGHVHIPRVGQEVVVAFHEGDPDQPHVVGVNYNPQQMPPFDLPNERTITGFKSHSKNGAANNFSGLLYNDADGQEHVQLHSERTMTHSAEHDFYGNTGRQHHVNVGQIHSCRVGGLDNNLFFTSGGGSGSGAEFDAESLGLHELVVGTEGSGRGGEFMPPFSWQFGLWGKFGAMASNVFGINASNTAGLSTSVTIGCNDGTVINPLGFLFGLKRGDIKGDAAAKLLEGASPFALAPIALGASMGLAKVVYGANTTMSYGPTTTVNKGTSWTIDAAQFESGVPSVFATLHALSCTSLFFIDQLKQNWAGGVDFALVSMLPAIALDCWMATAVLQQVEVSATKIVADSLQSAQTILQRQADELAAKIEDEANREADLDWAALEAERIAAETAESPMPFRSYTLRADAIEAKRNAQLALAETTKQPKDPVAVQKLLEEKLAAVLKTKTEGATTTLIALGVIETAAILSFFIASELTKSGSGSGSGMLEEADAPDMYLYDSGNVYRVNVPQITLGATPNNESEGAAIYLTAAGVPGQSGDIQLSAANSTFLTGGPLASMLLQTTEEEMGAISANAGPDGSIVLQCGEDMEPAGLTISAEEGILLNALEQISLRCLENMIEITPEGITLTAGDSVIELTPAGITIEGPMLTLSGDAEVSVDAGEVSVEAGSFNLESGDTNVDAGELNVSAADANVEAAMVSIL
ncbi:MAG: type VI secretion system tip protein TssI/VgrG [Pirellulales bacterium]